MNNIILLYGGNSVEHEISIITALQVYKKYKGKYNLLLCYLKDSIFYFSKKLSNINIYKNFDKNKKKLSKIKFNANENYIIHNFKKINFESVWIVSHGSDCEDGTLNAYFKTLNINVISENIYSGVIGQDKAFSKALCNVKTLPYFKISYYDYINNINEIYKKAEKLKYPLILKPSRLGSSIGIVKINNEEQLNEKLQESFYLCDYLIIEKYLKHFEEYNIAAFKLNNTILLSNIEKVSNNKILTYDDKYINNQKSMEGQQKQLPAVLPLELKNKIMETAKIIYNNLECSYIVRMDFLYDDIEDKLYFNEINNIPGSLALYLFEANNFDVNELLDNYLDEGIKQNDKEKQLIKTYNNNIFNNLSLEGEKIFK